MRFPAKWVVVVAVLAIVILALGTPRAWAHGGGVPRLTNSEAGPYWVSVWSQPDPLQVGQAHLTVAVSEPTGASGDREAGPPVLDAAVEVLFEPLDRSGEVLRVAATHENAANKLLYEADLELPTTGQWRVTLLVEGPDGSGSASFETQVAPPPAFRWTWVGGLGLVVLAAAWVVQRVRKQGDGA